MHRNHQAPSGLHKSTIVRSFNCLGSLFPPTAGRLLPGLVGRWAARRWTTIPRAAEAGRPVPPGGTGFTARFEGHVVRGTWWGEGPVVYLVHGWGGDARQWAPAVPVLSAAGYRVVTFDAPSHGGSDPGPSGPRRSDGVEFGKALDAVAAVHGPAHAVVAHSLGALATMLTLRYGWLSTRLLVFLAPMTDLRRPLDRYAGKLKLGRRAHRRFVAAVEHRAGMPVDTISLLALARYAEGAPLLVLHDRDDRRCPVNDSAEVVAAWPAAAELITTRGSGHSRLPTSAAVQHHIVGFLRSRPVPARDRGNPSSRPTSAGGSVVPGSADRGARRLCGGTE